MLRIKFSHVYFKIRFKIHFSSQGLVAVFLWLVLVVLGFELRASYLLGRCSTALVTLPAPTPNFFF
jgi:hypothetical protein